MTATRSEQAVSGRYRNVRWLMALGLVVAVLAVGISVMRSARTGGESWTGVPSGDIKLAQSEKPGLRVLFIGNSFTATNSLPRHVKHLAAADKGAQPIFAVQYAPGGFSFDQAASDVELEALLSSARWDYVVLQEQSQKQSFSLGQRNLDSNLSASMLDWKIRSHNAQTMLFMTWGYRDGDQVNAPGDSFTAMQSRVREGYEDLGRTLKAPVVPVGLAWEAAHVQDSSLELWQADGIHPTNAGSYLSASVFYAALTNRNPSNSGYDGDLDGKQSSLLRSIAWSTHSTAR